MAPLAARRIPLAGRRPSRSTAKAAVHEAPGRRNERQSALTPVTSAVHEWILDPNSVVVLLVVEVLGENDLAVQ